MNLKKMQQLIFVQILMHTALQIADDAIDLVKGRALRALVAVILSLAFRMSMFSCSS